MKLIATQSANVSVTFRNANGFPTDVEGEVAWTASNALATVVADEDDSSKATVTAGPSAGLCTITASADADLGAGVTPVTATLSVEVVARGEAVGGEIDVDSKDQGLPKPPPTPGNTLPGGGASDATRPDNTLPNSGAQPKK
jgi:hypothetical protein